MCKDLAGRVRAWVLTPDLAEDDAWEIAVRRSISSGVSPSRSVMAWSSVSTADESVYMISVTFDLEAGFGGSKRVENASSEIAGGIT